MLVIVVLNSWSGNSNIPVMSVSGSLQSCYIPFNTLYVFCLKVNMMSWVQGPLVYAGKVWWERKSAVAPGLDLNLLVSLCP